MSQTGRETLSREILKGLGIILLLFAISLYFPIIGFLCSLLIPLPVLFFRAKLGRKPAVFLSITSAVAMTAALGGVTGDVVLFSGLMLLGFMLGELFETDLPVEKTVGFSTAAVLVAGFIVLLGYSAVLQTGIFTLVSDYVTANIQLTLAFYQSMGMSEENLRIISGAMEDLRYILIRISPAIGIASTLVISWSTLLLARPLLKAARLRFPDFGTLNRWRAPENLVWLVIVSGLAAVTPVDGLMITGINGLIVLGTIYFFNGIAIVSYYFEAKHFSRPARICLYGLIALQQFLLIVVIGLGLFDIWLNFRKLEIQKNDQGRFGG